MPLFSRKKADKPHKIFLPSSVAPDSSASEENTIPLDDKTITLDNTDQNLQCDNRCNDLDDIEISADAFELDPIKKPGSKNS